MPKFAHLPLILKPDGKGKLSKRDGDRLGFPVFPIEWTSPEGDISSGYRESGYLPEAVVNMLAMLGWHPSDNKELFTLNELVDVFQLERVSKSGAKFDMDKSKWFNHQFLMRSNAQELKAMIEDQLLPIHTQKGEEYLIQVIDLLKEKVTFPSELLSMGQYFFDLPSSYDEKVQRKKWNEEVSVHINAIINGLVQSNLSKASQIEEYLDNYAEQNEVSKGKLMQPLRWVVSGQAGGPPIFDMLELIGLDEIVKRMRVVNDKF
jgi:glutamyl-tRNA synthetase